MAQADYTLGFSQNGRNESTNNKEEQTSTFLLNQNQRAVPPPSKEFLALLIRLSQRGISRENQPE